MADSQRVPLELGPTGVTLAIYRGKDGLGDLPALWSQLVEAMPAKRFFHLHAWYQSYLESLETDPSSLSFYVLFRGERPVALFPLKSATQNVCPFGLRSLELPVHDHLNLSDFVFDRTEENAGLLRLLIQHLQRCSETPWDVIYLSNVLEDSAAAYALEKAPPPMALSNYKRNSNYVDCALAYEDFLKNVDGHFRRNLGRLTRRVQQMGELQFHSYRSLEEIRSNFHHFVTVEAAGWKGDSGTQSAIACNPPIKSFYEKLIDRYAAAGQCWLNLLLLNDKAIAGQLCLLVDGTLYILKIGYDEAYSKVAPGNLVMDQTLRLAVEDQGVRAVSFITDRQWNYFWGAKSYRVYDHFIFNRSSLRGWYGYLCLRLKGLVRALRQRLGSAKDVNKMPVSPVHDKIITNKEP
jgi:CelD/BcsL family acetyltransferase involved in cellulose biosynthesis